MKKIIMTGGGTAGHVTPNIALFPALKEAGYEISYIGSYNGIEKGLIEDQGIDYYGINSGKFRRYHSWKNFTDPFRVLQGYFQAKKIIRKIKPDVIFSKGGFVSVPVILAAKRRHVPSIIHESDLTPGLANRLAIPSASKVCCNFPETLKHLPEGKAVLTGSPIRQELMHGNKEAAYEFCGFTSDLPVLMIMGGSIGSVYINNAIRQNIDELLKKYQDEGDFTSLFALSEEEKTLPFLPVWNRYCEEQNVPSGISWLDGVKKYERDVLSLRS